MVKAFEKEMETIVFAGSEAYDGSVEIAIVSR
jgi:hypothetical protein